MELEAVGGQGEREGTETTEVMDVVMRSLYEYEPLRQPNTPSKHTAAMLDRILQGDLSQPCDASVTLQGPDVNIRPRVQPQGSTFSL